jgi:murein DD-endopeptidase MepM/ murein hydrolase activator NlpD
MKRNYLTLVIQPASSASRLARNIASFSFHKRAVPGFFLCIVLLVAFGAYGSWEIFKNQALRQDVDALRASLSQLSQLEEKVARARREERKMRFFLGFEPGAEAVDIDERLGMGGVEFDAEDAMESFDPMAALDSLADERPLHEQVYSLREDLCELNTTLLQMTEALRTRPTIMPIQDDEIWMTSRFGWRKSPFTGLRQFHSGIDISGRKGALIIAPADGVVSSVGFDRFLGNHVRIQHDDRFETLYAHLLKPTVEKGDQVQRGQTIGLMGTSGMSTGYHLHYEIKDSDKKMNPYNFILNRDALMRKDSSRG